MLLLGLPKSGAAAHQKPGKDGGGGSFKMQVFSDATPVQKELQNQLNKNEEIKDGDEEGQEKNSFSKKKAKSRSIRQKPEEGPIGSKVISVHRELSPEENGQGEG